MFASIVLVPDINGSTPARVNRATRECWVSEKHMRKLPKLTQKFILYHEAGHILYGRSEFAADRHAFDMMVRSGASLRGIVRAILYVLPMRNDEQKERLSRILKAAIIYDATVNRYAPAIKSMEAINKLDAQNINFNYMSDFSSDIQSGGFLDPGQNSQLYNTTGAENLAAGIMSAVKGAKAPEGHQNAGAIFEGVMKGAKGLFAHQNQAPAYDAPAPPAYTPKQTDTLMGVPKTYAYIGIAVLVAVVLALIIFRKK